MLRVRRVLSTTTSVAVVVALTAALAPAAVPAPAAGGPTAAGTSSVTASAPDDRGRRMVLTSRSLGVGRVAPGIVGGNQRWIDEADGAWDPRTRTIRRDVARIVRRVGIGSLRYAGGTIANFFDYRKSVGRPGCQVSGGFAAPFFAPLPARRSGYTLSRHAAFADRTGATTNLLIPMLNTTVARATGFVRTMARITGQRRFVVEIGNEPYGDIQRYWRSPDLDRRLDQYIDGGTRVQDRKYGANRLFAAEGCDLRTPARATGRPNQTYRPRYTPISLAPRPVVRVAGARWTYVPDLADVGPRARVFTVTRDDRIRFGDGRRGAMPRGAMSIRYAAGPMLGFADLYPALKALSGEGIEVSVCSSWATSSFAAGMDRRGLDYDCLAPHTYADIRGVTGTVASFRRFMRAATLRNALLVRLRRAMLDSPRPGADDRFLAVTEFGGQNRSRPAQSRQFMNTLMLAVELVGQVRTGTRISDLSNFNTFLDRYGETFRPSLDAHLESLVARLVGQRPVVVDGVPTGLSVVGTRAGRRGALLVVNRRSSGAASLRLAAGDRGPASCATVRRLVAGPGTTKRPARPGTPSAVRRPTARTWRAGAPLPTTFPAHSVALVTYGPKDGRRCRAPSFLS